MDVLDRLFLVLEDVRRAVSAAGWQLDENAHPPTIFSAATGARAATGATCACCTTTEGKPVSRASGTSSEGNAPADAHAAQPEDKAVSGASGTTTEGNAAADAQPEDKAASGKPRAGAPGTTTKGKPPAGHPKATTEDQTAARRMNEAQAVVEATYTYIWKTKATLGQLKGRQRLWDLLTGDTLMSAYTNLHAAESTRVLLLSKEQLAAILPSIRQRAVAFLPKGDPDRDALDTVPDPTVPAHQTMTTRVQPPAPDQATKPDAAASAGKQAGGKKAGGKAGSKAGGKAGGKKAGGKKAGGSQNAGQGNNPPADGTTASPSPPGTNVLTPMLGADQQVAAQVMNAACRAEDLQQLRVRHFRGVLYGTSFVLFVVVAVLWILGSVRPTYFPLCWPVPASKPPTMICPTGGHAASIGSVPIVLGMGAIGALLAVALNLAGLKPAGARFSLTVAQGLLKIPFGAITAVLGIILLRTLTNAPGFLATQAGLLTAAVVFGYSQQLFTRLVDNQASVLLNAAASTTPAAQPTT